MITKTLSTYTAISQKVSTGKENFQQYDSRYNVTNKIAQPITVTVVKDGLTGENDIIEIPT